MDTNADSSDVQAALRALPSVDHLLQQPAVATLLDEFPRAELLAAVRQTLDEQREGIRAGASPRTGVPNLALEIRQKLYQRARPNLRPVINATGVVLHTGLGRAPLAREAVEAVAEVAGGYCNLELELETGRRGDRHENIRGLLRELTGAEDGIVVNNNAAATFLTLNTLAGGGEAIISRGQLVEIGGSYRIPDIMAASGCRMVEVGTTNRTRIADYERAITVETRALLRVHTSNYRIQGFVESASLAELAELARKYAVQDICVIDDLGSGLLANEIAWPVSPQVRSGATPGRAAAEHIDGEGHAAPPSAGARGAVSSIERWDEPTVCDSVSEGAHLTLFSGDKLLGGPQAGIIVGRAALIARLRGNPLMRTYRPDKLTLAGLEATLRIYRDPESVHRRIPALRMLAQTPERLEPVAERLAGEIARLLPEATVVAEADHSAAGGGSLPLLRFPTWVVRVGHSEVAAGALAAGLRRRDVPVICRVREDRLVFDCLTLGDGEAEQIPGALADVVRELSSADEAD